jgi:hypothetical protein
MYVPVDLIFRDAHIMCTDYGVTLHVQEMLGKPNIREHVSAGGRVTQKKAINGRRHVPIYPCSVSPPVSVRAHPGRVNSFPVGSYPDF